MNRNMTIGVALALSLLAWLFYRMHIGRTTAELAAVYGRQTPVWVATRDMLAGHVLTARDLEVSETPLAFVQPGALTNLDWAAEGLTVQVPLRKGEQILATKLAQDGAGLLSLRIRSEPGFRAVTLKMDGEGGLAGLLQPHDRVDIVGVFESAASSADSTRSHAAVLAQAVRVLAVDQRMGERAMGAELPAEPGAAARLAASVPMAVHVTVEVTAGEAWRLSLASQMAYLRCVLRHRRNEAVEPLAPPPERLPALKGDEAFGARVPVKIRTAARRPLDDLGAL